MYMYMYMYNNYACSMYSIELRHQHLTDVDALAPYVASIEIPNRKLLRYSTYIHTYVQLLNLHSNCNKHIHTTLQVYIHYFGCVAMWGGSITVHWSKRPCVHTSKVTQGMQGLIGLAGVIPHYGIGLHHQTWLVCYDEAQKGCDVTTIALHPRPLEMETYFHDSASIDSCSSDIHIGCVNTALFLWEQCP